MELNRKVERVAKGKKCFALMIKGKAYRFRTEDEMYAFAEYKENKNEWRRFYRFNLFEDYRRNYVGQWQEIGVLPPLDIMGDYMRALTL